MVFDVPGGKTDLFAGQVDALRHLGFDIEPFGSGSYRLRSLPGVIAGMVPQEALRVVIEDFEEDETPLQGELEAKLIARI